MRSLLRPTNLDAAVASLATRPRLVPMAGATALMLAMDVGAQGILDLSRVDELHDVVGCSETVRIGACVTMATLATDAVAYAPALAEACATVGSPQIRRRATIGGALALGHRGSDLLAPLLACGARAELRANRGTRTVDVAAFVDPGAIAPDELLTAVMIRPARGPQCWVQTARRSSVAPSTCAVAVALDPAGRSLVTAIAADRTSRAEEADEFAVRALGADDLWGSSSSLPRPLVERYARLASRRSGTPVAKVLCRRALHACWERRGCV